MDVFTTTYAERGPEIRAIRHAVFVVEQGVPAELEADERDATSLHALALIDLAPVGTARIDLDRGGKIGRVAVLPPHRGQGIGTQLMRHLTRAAEERGLTSVWLHAQESAVSFYERLGYTAEGESFYEAGLPHRRMRCPLPLNQHDEGGGMKIEG